MFYCAESYRLAQIACSLQQRELYVTQSEEGTWAYLLVRDTLKLMDECEKALGHSHPQEKR